MPTLLPGISHAIIFFNTIAGENSSGIGAMMKLCFGSDDNAISQIVYSAKKGSSSHSWSLPVRQSNGTTYPIFSGLVAEEMLAAVGRASDRFKKADIKGIKAGRTFRVTKTTVEEVVKQTAVSTK